MGCESLPTRSAVQGIRPNAVLGHEKDDDDAQADRSLKGIPWNLCGASKLQTSTYRPVPGTSKLGLDLKNLDHRAFDSQFQR
ncbi:hypothetical protein ACJ73_02865 [Blastomyces percursus]|uniref:Uncharacterized protein n=1 Tax=Blastomyces percursus TaxID=1658174 RepID=A0A1J9RB68_9EURO|nr:hypothetical protein ACJ73_02865 [Blastomyces percursus]